MGLYIENCWNSLTRLAKVTKISKSYSVSQKGDTKMMKAISEITIFFAPPVEIALG
jgi:hypothetical protein